MEKQKSQIQSKMRHLQLLQSPAHTHIIAGRVSKCNAILGNYKPNEKIHIPCSYFFTEGVRTMGAGSGSAKMFDFMRSTTRRRGDSVGAASANPKTRFFVSASEPRRLEAAELGVELVSDS